MQPLYENIKRLRLQKGWSQQRLADMVGYSDRSSIAKIESGLVDLSRSKIEEFADALGVSPVKLMGIEGTDKKVLPVAEDKHSDLINGDPELTAYLDSLRVANDCTKEDVEKAVAVIEALRKTEGK